jgi:hypothetical protein
MVKGEVRKFSNGGSPNSVRGSNLQIAQRGHAANKTVSSKDAKVQKTRSSVEFLLCVFAPLRLCVKLLFCGKAAL